MAVDAHNGNTLTVQVREGDKADRHPRIVLLLEHDALKVCAGPRSQRVAKTARQPVPTRVMRLARMSRVRRTHGCLVPSSVAVRALLMARMMDPRCKPAMPNMYPVDARNTEPCDHRGRGRP